MCKLQKGVSDWAACVSFRPALTLWRTPWENWSKILREDEYGGSLRTVVPKPP